MRNEEDHGNEWLPKKDKGMAWNTGKTPEAKDSLYFHKLYTLIDKRKLWRQLSGIPHWLFRSDTEWHQVKSHYEIDAKINQYQLDNVPETSVNLWDEYCITLTPDTGICYA